MVSVPNYVIMVIVSKKYAVNIGEHVFATEKFIRTARLLVSEGIIGEKDLTEPALPSRQDLLLAHTPEWIEKIVDGKMTAADEELSEIPYSPEISAAHRLAVGGTILACESALGTGLGLHSGGGSHHAFSDHGEGFCILNDIAVAVRRMQKDGKIKRAMVVDLDVHQGNGTAAIFKNSPEVFTFSMHQKDIYPETKEKSSLDIELDSGTGDKEYLSLLSKNLPLSLENHKPDLVIYVAGADCYQKDQLGGLKLTFEGLKARDEMVFKECFTRKIPVAAVLGGGYAFDLDDTVKIHAQTLRSGLNLRGSFY